VKSISGFPLPAYAGTSLAGMTNKSLIEGRHSRESGNPAASIWQLLHVMLGFLNNQNIF
jgi:hypothetical protein